jgi:hypothetical protein
VPHGSSFAAQRTHLPFRQTLVLRLQHSPPQSVVPLGQMQRLIAHSRGGGQQMSPHASCPRGHFRHTPFLQKYGPGGQHRLPQRRPRPGGQRQAGSSLPGNGLQTSASGQHSRPQGRSPRGQRRHFPGELETTSQISPGLQHPSGQQRSRGQQRGFSSRWQQISSAPTGSQQSSPHRCAGGHRQRFVFGSQSSPGLQHLVPQRRRPFGHFLRHFRATRSHSSSCSQQSPKQGRRGARHVSGGRQSPLTHLRPGSQQLGPPPLAGR